MRDVYHAAKLQKVLGYTKLRNIIINRAVSRDAGYKGRIDSRVTTWKDFIVNAGGNLNDHSTLAVPLTELEGMVNEAKLGEVAQTGMKKLKSLQARRLGNQMPGLNTATDAPMAKLHQAVIS